MRTPNEVLVDKSKRMSYTDPTAHQVSSAAKEMIPIGDLKNGANQLPEWLSVSAVAKLRNVSREAVRAAIERQRLQAEPVFDEGSRYTVYRIHRDWLKAWEEYLTKERRGGKRTKKAKTESQGRNGLALAQA